MPEEETLSLTRPPKGFAADDPAVDLISRKQWGISASLPVEKALSPSLAKDVLDRFRVAAPLIELLNAPLIANLRKKPMF